MIRIRLLAAVAGGALLAIGSAGTAHAVPAYAYDVLTFSNFTLDLGTGVVVSSVVTGQTSSSATGFAPSSQIGFGSISGGLAVPLSYSGVGSVTPNIFTPQLTSQVGAQGQLLISGGLTTGATSSQVTEAHLTAAGIAGSQTSTNTGLTVDFLVTGTTAVTLSFDATTFMTASFGLLGDSATAKVSASYTLTNSGTGAVVRNAAPSELNTGVIASTPGVAATFSSPLTHYSYTDILGPGRYQFSLQDQTNATVTTVEAPEPASLAILGVGLLGLAGFVRRRQRR